MPARAGPDYCGACQAARKEVDDECVLLRDVGDRVAFLEGQALNMLDEDEARDRRLDEHETEIAYVVRWLRENAQ